MKFRKPENRVHIIEDQTNVWSVVKEILANYNQTEAFYVCDAREIVRQQKIWEIKLPRVQPYYVVKCNDSLFVLEMLNALGVNFSCASKTEMNKILSFGVNPERIIFANPTKLSSNIQFASEAGVSLMTFNSEAELHKIKKLYPDARLMIRIKCDALDKKGCDSITEAAELLRFARGLNLDVVGVSFHVSSELMYQRAIETCRMLFDQAENIGFHFELLDIGGGFPGGKAFPIDKIAEVINEALEELFPDPSVQVIAEPGSFYVASAYTLACNIQSVRNVVRTDETGNVVETRTYYINDGVYSSFNRVLCGEKIDDPQPLEERPDAAYYSSTICGPTCDVLDEVVKDVLLPDMKIGDWLVFEDMGAYSLSMTSPFNGFPVPKTHVITDESLWYLLKDAFQSINEHFEMLTIPDAMKEMECLQGNFQIRFQLPFGSNVSDFIE